MAWLWLESAAVQKLSRSFLTTTQGLPDCESEKINILTKLKTISLMLDTARLSAVENAQRTASSLGKLVQGVKLKLNRNFISYA